MNYSQGAQEKTLEVPKEIFKKFPTAHHVIIFLGLHKEARTPFLGIFFRKKKFEKNIF
jgi:hypothetical protein